VAELDVKKQEVIDELKASGNFVTRDELHTELMDALKDVKPIRPDEFDARGPRQEKMVMDGICKYYSVVFGERKAWDSVTTHIGLELIPSLVAGRIVEKLDVTPVRKLVTIFPGDKGTIGVENALPAAARMGAARAAATETAGTHAEITYTTFGGTAFLQVDNKLIRNATPAIVTYIENAMVRSVSRLETIEFLTGAAASRQFIGLRTGATAHDALAPIDTLPEITAAQVEADYWALGSQYRDNATWVLPGTVAAQIYSLSTANNKLMDLQAKTILGRPYVEFPEALFEAPADTKIYSYFGDMSYFYLFEDRPLQLVASDQGYTLVTTDRTVIAAQFETDGKVVLAEAINGNKYNSA
jgi:HK97 family phage major capsid protein